MSIIPIVLTIAGSDSGGGAGIQADIKSFSANHTYGASVITALTAQNTMGVTAIQDVPLDFITAQMDAVFSDLDIKAVKIGMLATKEIIAIVAAGLQKWNAKNIVVDPVMVTTSGDPLIADDAVESLKTKLFPLADLVTPNLHEAARLTHGKLAANRNEMRGQGKGILSNGPKAVLIKGGHATIEGDQSESSDLLLTAKSDEWFDAKRIDTQNTHGTGCSLSSAIAANLAKGLEMSEAVKLAKFWLTGAIFEANQLDIGKGHGPVHHFHNLYPKS
jgi:hydroxymethylpyrimidine/phosphomethylpyrimidine kinase